MHASTCNRSYHNFKIRTNIRIRCRPCSRLLWCRPVECCAWARQLVRQPAAPSNGPNGHTGSVFTSQVRAGAHVALLWVRLFATRSPAKQRSGGVAPPGSEQADGRRRVALAVAMNRRSWSTHRRPRCSEPFSARNIRRACTSECHGRRTPLCQTEKGLRGRWSVEASYAGTLSDGSPMTTWKY